jgi:hypothetical protein
MIGDVDYCNESKSNGLPRKTQGLQTQVVSPVCFEQRPWIGSVYELSPLCEAIRSNVAVCNVEPELWNQLDSLTEYEREENAPLW